MITRTEAMEIGHELFDEYLPKVSTKARTEYLAALFSELSEFGALELEEDDSVDAGVDNLFDDPEAL